MADSCSTSDEEHAILLCAMAVLQQMDQEENETKPERNEEDGVFAGELNFRCL